MPSRFDRYDKLAGKAVDRTFAEPFDFLPRARSANGRSTDDAGRNRISGRGVFGEKTGPAALQVGDRKSAGGNDFRNTVNVRTPQLDVARSVFDGGELPHQGDRIRMTDRPGSPEFEISSVRPDGHSRVLLILTSIGAANV